MRTAKPASKPRAKPAPKTYKAYIPTHLRNFILLEPQEGNPLKVHREALFENAILNNYYRLIRDLIDSGVLKETTYYFTCRDTPKTRIHRPIGGKYDNGYTYVYPHDGEETIEHTKNIEHQEDYEASKTAHVALQMAARYGNIKSYMMVEDVVEKLTKVLGYHIVSDYAVGPAAILAINRDEIELFNYVRDRTRYHTEDYIYHANSLICIKHFMRTTTIREKKRLLANCERAAEILCRRRRWDLFQGMTLKSEWYHYAEDAIEHGFTELLNELTDLDRLVELDHDPVEVMSVFMEERLSDPEAILRSLKWLKKLQPKCMESVPSELLIHYLTPEMIDWFCEIGYKLEPHALAKYLGYDCDFVEMYGFPSVEVANWEACICNMRSLGWAPPAKKMYYKTDIPTLAIVNEIARKYPEYYTIADPIEVTDDDELIEDEVEQEDENSDLEDAQLD